MGEEIPSSSEDPKRADSHRLKRGLALLSTAGLMLVVGAGVFMVTGIAGAEDEPSPDTTPVSTATATPTPTATPVRYWLDGTSETLVEQVAEDVWLGELTVSPDGRSLLAGGIAGPLRMVDLETGAISEFERAPQPVQAGNRCGGSIGKLSDWLAGGRIVYHESLAQKGSNGITIGDLRTGRRQVLSFWNIADLDAIGPDLVTFTSFEQMNEVSFQLAWLLDTATGEARPVAVGTEAGWVK